MDGKLGIRRFGRELLDALYPARCLLCGASSMPGDVGCADHRPPRAPRSDPACPRCGRPLPAALAKETSCAPCRRRAPGFARLVALGEYGADRDLREWVLAFKHRGGADFVQPLARALVRAWLAEVDRGKVREAVLVPVPLHSVRRFARGFDQAAVLAAAVAAEVGIPWLRALRRVRGTVPQGSPGARSRSANVRGAFAASRHRAELRAVEGRSVWLVDDVVTTGSTAAECARALRRLGAVRVSVLCLARAASEGADGEGRGDELVSGARTGDPLAP